MFSIEQNDGPPRIMLASAREEIAMAVDAAKDFAAKRNAERVPLTLAMHELLLNAIEHRNEDHAHRLVRRISQHSSSDEPTMFVADDGSRFGYRSIDLAIPENPPGPQHRGLKFVRPLTDRLEFNDCGNAVTVFVSRASSERGVLFR